jgi:hypothetical protein
MEETPKELDQKAVERALRDLHNRTLGKLDGDFARLVYLASARDYNTGRYAHDGLIFHFSESVANWVLLTAHREVFINLALCPIKVFVNRLEQYVRSGCAQPDELLTTWKNLEAYRILAPAGVDSLTVKLFISNVKIALAIVGSTWAQHHPEPGPQSAWQRP